MAKALFITAIVVAIPVVLLFLALGRGDEGIKGLRPVEDDGCTVDSDCSLPEAYVLRSSCAYQGICYLGECRVGCVGPWRSEEDMLARIPQCANNLDCDCTSFYLSGDMKKCACLAGQCVAIVG